MAPIIDTASSSRSLSGEELRAWAASHSVFISSEMQLLGPERQAVAARLRELGMRVVVFEDLGGRDEDAERAYLDGVATSDVYLGIVGERYGAMLASGRSPTHEEYLEARRRGKRISVWVGGDAGQRQGNARDFVAEVEAFHTTGNFTDPEDLATRVVDRVAELAADDESPWVKVGEAVFRADAVRDGGATIEVEASVRDQAVARYLEGLRADNWGRAQEVVITTSERSGQARVTEVVSEVRSQSVRRITLKATVAWPDGRGSSMDAGVQGLSADDVTEAGLRTGLFAEGLPSQLGVLEFMADPSDPLAELSGQALAEGSVEPIARLLIVERLVGAGKAASVDSFEIGPSHGGQRRVALSYTEPRRYSNVEPEQRSIDGSWSG